MLADARRSTIEAWDARADGGALAANEAGSYAVGVVKRLLYLVLNAECRVEKNILIPKHQAMRSPCPSPDQSKTKQVNTECRRS